MFITNLVWHLHRLVTIIYYCNCKTFADRRGFFLCTILVDGLVNDYEDIHCPNVCG